MAKIQTRAEWEAERDAENLRMGTWGFDPGMPWHVANWRERTGIVLFNATMWGVVFPAMLVAGLLVFGSMMEGIGRYNAEHDRCLKQAHNGYDIRECH